MQNDFISFFDARAFLTKKFGKMPSYAEFWMWSFFGKGGGGIDAYYQSDRGCPNKEYEKYQMQSSHLVMFKNIKEVAIGIKHFWYLRSEIESFEPIDRFITADELIERWTAMLDSEEEAKNYINSYAREAADWEDNNSILRNQYCGAYSPTTKAFEPLKGVYTFEDILAVENHCHMTEPQAETLGNDGANSQDDKEPTSTKVIQARDDGTNKTRKRELHRFIWRARLSLIELGKRCTWLEVWREIEKNYKQHDQDNIIQEVNMGLIFYCSSGGNEQTYKKASLSSLITRLKKKPPF